MQEMILSLILDMFGYTYVFKEKTKTLKFFIKFKMGKKQYEIDFKYDLERDNPSQIAKEMKENLKLP